MSPRAPIFLGTCGYINELRLIENGLWALNKNDHKLDLTLGF